MANEEKLVLSKVKFKIDTIVYIKTDPKQRMCQVVSIEITPNGYLYRVKWGIDEEGVFYDVELSTVRDEAFFLKNYPTESEED